MTNSHKTEETEVKVKKVWNDADNQDGYRTDDVTVNLLADGEVIDTVKLSEENNWSYGWTKLDKKAAGKEIDYTVTEDEVPEYTTKIDKAEDGTFTYTVTNSHETEKMQVEVEKIWDDNDNAEGFRPESVTVKLLANGEEAGTATLNEDNEWKYTWTGLDKNSDGAEIEYTVTEDQLENYKVPVIEKVSETGWAYTVTNSRDFEETEVNVTKVWEDAENQDGCRPEVITVNLLADGETIDTVELREDDNWSFSWSQLQKYRNGEAIDYTVTEEPVENYETQITKAEDGTFTYTVTNSHETEKTQVEVEKIWEDKDNVKGFRPANVTVKLLANGEEAGEATLDADNEWKYTWTDLDKYSEGEEIEYTVEEEQAAGYLKPVIMKTAEDAWVFTVTNTQTEVSVSKVDIANGDELPGAHIEILREATEADAEDENTKYADETKTLVIVEEWISEKEPHVIEGLLTDTEYILRETVAPNGYDIATDTKFTIDEEGNVTSTGSVTEDGILLVEDGMLFVTAAVKKVWDDGNNQDGVRPLTLRVNLLANGKKIDSVVLSMANGWMASIGSLPMVDADQKDIEYTWEEEAPGNRYTLTSQEKKGTLTVITNSRPPEETGVSVQKIWDDSENAYKTRPESIRVQLYADGEACGEEVILNAANNWKAEWTGLDKFANADGQSGHAAEVIYTVEELNVPEGYKATVTGNAATGFVIRNVLERGKLIIEKTFEFGEVEPDEPDDTPMDIPVIKTWNDNGNKDGNRPASVMVRLLADGTEVASAELTAAGGWRTVFTGLPRYNGEKKITYTITEDPVAWYEAEINGFNIRNNYVPEVTSATVRKVWDDNNNAEKMRPSSIHVTLSNGTTVLLSEENNWTATINNLPTRVNGKPVTYTWTEQTVIAYKLSKTERQGNTTIFTNVFTQVPKIPEGPKKPTTPEGTWQKFEEYTTPLGVQTIINHVGDCFD